MMVKMLPWARSLPGPVTKFTMIDDQEDDGCEDDDEKDHNQGYEPAHYQDVDNKLGTGYY